MRSRAALDDNKTMRGFVVHVEDFRIKRKSTTFSRCSDCNDFCVSGFLHHDKVLTTSGGVTHTHLFGPTL